MPVLVTPLLANCAGLCRTSTLQLYSGLLFRDCYILSVFVRHGWLVLSNLHSQGHSHVYSHLNSHLSHHAPPAPGLAAGAYSKSWNDKHPCDHLEQLYVYQDDKVRPARRVGRVE